MLSERPAPEGLATHYVAGMNGIEREVLFVQYRVQPSRVRESSNDTDVVATFQRKGPSPENHGPCQSSAEIDPFILL